jgi:hypothetical protein
MNHIAALDTLTKFFNTSNDLMEIAFGLQVQDSLNEHDAPRTLARELISNCEARGKLSQLADLCSTERPDVGVDWHALFAPDLPTADPPPTPSVPPTPALPPLAGVWNVTTMMGFIGTTTLFPNGTFQVSSANGQAAGQWAFNPALNLLGFEGWLNGTPFNGALSIQQWLPTGFMAVGEDGVLYTYLRAG